ncbi:MAG: hypothetical protein ACK58T_43595, partial [Phycisphaerae bacterium]
MNRPEDDSLNRKAEKTDPLTEHYQWLKPGEGSELGGELLFDEYDDKPSSVEALLAAGKSGHTHDHDCSDHDHDHDTKGHGQHSEPQLKSASLDFDEDI